MLETLLISAAAVNRIVEFVKRILPADMDTDLRKLLLFAVQLIAGVFVVATASSAVNLFAGTILDRFPPLLSIALTGVTVGLGADFIHFVLDLINALKHRQVIAEALVEYIEPGNGSHA